MRESVPPHSVEAEQAVLGCILLDPERVLNLCVEKGLKSDGFYVDLHKTVYEGCWKLAQKRGPERINILTVGDFLKPEVSGDTLEPFIDSVPTATEADYYIDILLRDKSLRDIITTSQKAIETAQSGEHEPSSICAAVVSHMTKTLEVGHKEQTPAQLHEELVTEWTSPPDPMTGSMPSQWLPLENLIGSYKPSELVVYAAGTSNGKTTSMCSEAMHFALDYGAPSAIASLEMHEKVLREMLVCHRAQINNHKFRRKQFTEEDLNKAKAAMAEIEKAPLFIVGRRMSLNEFKAWVVHMVLKHGIRFLGVDFLQLLRQDMHDKEQAAMNRTRFVGECINATKELAVRYNLVVLAMSQISRGDKERSWEIAPPLPSLASLRDSGELEQSADKVLIMGKKPKVDYMTFYGKPDADWPMRWDLAKNRTGPTGCIDMMFVRKYGQFETEDQYAERKYTQERHA